MTDAALDREIARALAVDPSPEFAARVRQRIAGEPAPASWLGVWIFAAAGALVAAAMVLIVVSRAPRVVSTATAPAVLSARALSNVGRMQPSAASGFSRMPSSVTAIRTATFPRGDGDREPDILVDPREARAIRAFFEGVRSGRIDLAPLAAVAPRVGEPPAIPDIYIAPIVIDSLSEPSGTGGVRQ